MIPASIRQRLFICCLVTLFTVFVVQKTESSVSTFSTRSFTNTQVGSDPYKLTVQNGIIRVDLTAIQKANVVRATLDPYVVPNASTDRYQIVGENGQALPLFPPRYLTFDATNVVKQALVSGKKELVLRVVDDGQGIGKTVSLNVWSDAPAPRRIQQVTQTVARHQQGDTIISFREIVSPPVWGDEWTFGAYSAAVKAQAHDKPTRTRYRIYRSTVPFSSPSVLASAELVDEIMPYSGWNANFNGNEPKSGSKAHLPIPMLPLADGVLATPGTGIYVRRHTGFNQNAYYFVSTVMDGAEDFASLQNGASPMVSEYAGSGMTLRWKTRQFNSNWQQSSFIDARFDYLIRWEPDPLPSKPFNYRLAVPTGPEASNWAPLTINLHAWNGDFDDHGAWKWKNYQDGALLLTANLLDYTGGSATHEFKGTLRPWQDGTAQPFYQARLLGFIYDYLILAYGVNTQNMVLFGESMGGTGVHLWGIRSGHIFSQLFARVGHHIPASDMQWRWQFEANGYGRLAWNIRYSNTQLVRFGYPHITPPMNVSVWDYFDNNQWLRRHPTVEIPYLTFSNAPNDRAIGWDEAWLVTQALVDTKRAFNFAWSMHGHGSPLPAAPANVERSQAIPAFSHSSLDNFLGTTSRSGHPSGALNRYQTWRPETIVDTANHWSVVLSLTADAPSHIGSVDLTLRRLQQFLVTDGARYEWRLVNGDGVVLQSGFVSAENNLLTITNLSLTKQPATLTISRLLSNSH